MHSVDILWGYLVGKKKIEIRFTFFLFNYKEDKENWNWHVNVILVEIFIIIMIIVYFILHELAAMSLLGWRPPDLMDNTDTLYLGYQYWCFFMFISLPIYPSVCMSVDLFEI